MSDEVLAIKADIEPHELQAACRALAEQVAATKGQSVEFDGPEPNVFALQIALACRRSLTQKGQFLGFGPNAQQSLGDLLKSTH